MSSAAQRIGRCVVVGLALATALAARCADPPDDLLLLGTVERTLIEVAPPLSEQILEIPVARGQHVEVGDVLVRLDALLTEADLAAAGLRSPARRHRTRSRSTSTGAS
jgi:multidrug efflux pump subunit AcrA (membrane-fusion protein)